MTTSPALPLAERAVAALESISRMHLPEHAELLGYEVAGALDAVLTTGERRSRTVADVFASIDGNLADIAKSLRTIARQKPKADPSSRS